MALTFRCDICKKRKFFSSYQLVKKEKICQDCLNEIKEQEELRKKQKEEWKKKKLSKKKINEDLANKKLLEELEKDKHIKPKIKEVKEKKEKTVIKETKVPKQKQEKPKQNTSENELVELSEIYDTLLYIHVTVKRVKAIEWRNQKKKVLLNKEREIRHTHKGGWSQEKFQSFVDFKKKHAFDWIEDVLSRKGVLRPPYNKIIVESDNKDLKKKLQIYIKNFEKNN